MDDGVFKYCDPAITFFTFVSGVHLYVFPDLKTKKVKTPEFIPLSPLY